MHQRAWQDARASTKPQVEVRDWKVAVVCVGLWPAIWTGLPNASSGAIRVARVEEVFERARLLGGDVLGAHPVERSRKLYGRGQWKVEIDGTISEGHEARVLAAERLRLADSDHGA